MKVYVGQFRYVHEGHVDVLLATTESKIKELLTNVKTNKASIFLEMRF